MNGDEWEKEQRSFTGMGTTVNDDTLLYKGTLCSQSPVEQTVIDLASTPVGRSSQDSGDIGIGVK